jgi:hypothetical protein
MENNIHSLGDRNNSNNNNKADRDSSHMAVDGPRQQEKSTLGKSAAGTMNSTMKNNIKNTLPTKNLEEIPSPLTNASLHPLDRKRSLFKSQVKEFTGPAGPKAQFSSVSSFTFPNSLCHNGGGPKGDSVFNTII